MPPEEVEAAFAKVTHGPLPGDNPEGLCRKRPLPPLSVQAASCHLPCPSASVLSVLAPAPEIYMHGNRHLSEERQGPTG